MRVHHRIDGAGTPLLLVNSLGTALELWEPQVISLGGRHRLVRYDQRGHGGTPAPHGPYTIETLAGDALELLDRLGLERVSVCGLSIGGAVATWIAAHAGDRVDRLVVASAGARFATPETWVDRAATVRAEGTEAVVDGVLERWFTPALAAAHPDVVARFRAAFCDREPRGLRRLLRRARRVGRRRRICAGSSPRRSSSRAPTTRSPRRTGARSWRTGSRTRGSSSWTTAPTWRASTSRTRSPTRCFSTWQGRRDDRRRARRAGMRVRREVLGDEHVDRADGAPPTSPRDFQDLITRYAWGEIWTRPGLDRRTRS